MTPAEARALTRKHLASLLEGDLDGKGESVMKEVWEEVSEDPSRATYEAANDELLRVIRWLRGPSDAGPTPHQIEQAKDAHEKDAQAFFKEIERVLVEGMKLSSEHAAAVFVGRTDLQHRLRGLLGDAAHVARTVERQRLFEEVERAFQGAFR